MRASRRLHHQHLFPPRAGRSRQQQSPLLAQRFPHLGTVKEVMRACLKDLRSQFDLAVPQTLLDNVVKNLPNETVEWAGYWRERYGV